MMSVHACDRLKERFGIILDQDQQNELLILVKRARRSEGKTNWSIPIPSNKMKLRNLEYWKIDLQSIIGRQLWIYVVYDFKTRTIVTVISNLETWQATREKR